MGTLSCSPGLALHWACCMTGSFSSLGSSPAKFWSLWAGIYVSSALGHMNPIDSVLITFFEEASRENELLEQNQEGLRLTGVR